MLATLVCYAGFKLNILVCLVLNIVLSFIFFWKHLGGLKGILAILSPSAVRAAEIMVAASCLAAIGMVVAATPAMPIITNALFGMNIPPLFKAFVAIAVLAAFTGSGPAALSASLPNLGPTFLSMGINVNALHRVATFTSQTFDSLPSNPAIGIISKMCETTVNKSYKYVAITCLIDTTIAALVVALILTLFPGLA
jgi:H+/gluconate symporter-like permease